MSGVRDIWFYANNIINSARQMVNEELQSSKLSSAEGNVLLHLLARQEVPCQEDLVEELEISKPAVSRALCSLEKKGFVIREKDPEDRRLSRVFLTSEALTIGPTIEKIYENVFSLAAEGVSPEEIRIFIELFRRVSESFTRARIERKNNGGAHNDSK